MFSFGKKAELQAVQSSTWTPLIRSYAVVIPFSVDSAVPDMQVANIGGTNSFPYHQRCRVLNCMIISRGLFSSKDMGVYDFQSSHHRTVLHFDSVHFELALAQIYHTSEMIEL